MTKRRECTLITGNLYQAGDAKPRLDATISKKRGDDMPTEQLSEDEMMELKRTLARRVKNRKEGKKAMPFLIPGLILVIGVGLINQFVDLPSELTLFLYAAAIVLLITAFLVAKLT